MKIIFMGTPDFAVPTLKKLYDSGYEVQAVFTQPDKPKGRGYKLTPPPVKVLAQEHCEHGRLRRIFDMLLCKLNNGAIRLCRQKQFLNAVKCPECKKYFLA